MLCLMMLVLLWFLMRVLMLVLLWLLMGVLTLVLLWLLRYVVYVLLLLLLISIFVLKNSNLTSTRAAEDRPSQSGALQHSFCHPSFIPFLVIHPAPSICMSLGVKGRSSMRGWWFLVQDEVWCGRVGVKKVVMVYGGVLILIDYYIIVYYWYFVVTIIFIEFRRVPKHFKRTHNKMTFEIMKNIMANNPNANASLFRYSIEDNYEEDVGDSSDFFFHNLEREISCVGFAPCQVRVFTLVFRYDCFFLFLLFLCISAFYRILNFTVKHLSFKEEDEDRWNTRRNKQGRRWRC